MWIWKAIKRLLEEEQKRLLELMEKAETMEDIITIESRLTEVRYQLEAWKPSCVPWIIR